MRLPPLEELICVMIGDVRLLILGGTMFVGRAIASQALAMGWTVTTFNRGVSGSDLSGVEIVRGHRFDASDLRRLGEAGPWDAIVDASGYVPKNVLEVAAQLRSRAPWYVFLSTVSVYAGWPRVPLSELSDVLDAPADAGPDFGVDIEDGPTKYGYQKAGCEVAVADVYGERSTILRPGVVLGPHEYVGRLPWWLRRVARGGQVLAPGSPDRSIQPVDVRDLATFALRCVHESIAGVFNVTAPGGLATFGGLLNACAATTGASPEFVWISEEVLVRLGVRQWSEIPLWRTYPGVWSVDSSRALQRGLTTRSLDVTVRDTWAWMQKETFGADHERATELGLTPEREQAFLRSARGIQ
jgi:nucleoside-diphosphate-sugar epimerase